MLAWGGLSTGTASTMLYDSIVTPQVWRRVTIDTDFTLSDARGDWCMYL